MPPCACGGIPIVTFDCMYCTTHLLIFADSVCPICKKEKEHDRQIANLQLKITELEGTIDSLNNRLDKQGEQTSRQIRDLDHEMRFR